MSESKIKVGRGLAYIITTGEPVFVEDIQTSMGEGPETARIVRAVVTTNGIEHRPELFSVSQLETPYSNTKRAAQRQVEHEDIILALREKSDEKRYTLSKAFKDELVQAAKPSHQVN